MNLKKLFGVLGLILIVALFAAPIRGDDEEGPSFSLPEEELEKLRENAETFHFQAEVNRMMTLIINSLYKNKEIFLRELISNASDALDKIRFLSLTSPDALAANSDLSIKIQADEENNILHIADSGVGMTKEDLIKNLGTIAKSGTAEFLKNLEKEGDSNLIGQFGVGFYSVFLVADRVTVTTKHNDDKQYIWESTAESDFTIIEDPRGDTLGRGTVISLHLKPETADYLNQDTLKGLIKKYSEFINFPIYLWTTKTETLEVPSDVGEEKEEGDEEEVSEENEEGVEDVEEEEEEEVEEEEEEGAEGQEGVKIKKTKPKTKLIEETKSSFELINDSKPIWLRPSGEVSEKEYNDFFKSFFKETENPLAHSHFKAEGEVEFRSLLFVPPKAPGNLYSNELVSEIKLFVRRVFITDVDTEPLLPNYLRFIKGIVDSDDLPLNVSRETLQQSKLLKVIKKKLTKKALDMLKDLASEDPEKYLTLYKEFSASLKLGVIEDASNRRRLAKLLRFYTSESPKNLTDLDSYLDRFKVGQESIYFLAGATIEEIQSSPFLERLSARGLEVLFLADPIDEYAFQSLTEYEGKKLVNAAKENLDLVEDEEEEESEEELKDRFEPLLKWFEDVLSEYVDRAIISKRLTTSPCALVAASYGWSGNMERIMQAQAYAKPDDPMTSFYMKQKKTLEVNPKHPVIVDLFNKVDQEQVDEETKEVARVLFDTATLRSGFALRNPVDFATRIEKIIRLNLGVDVDAKVEVEEEKLPLAKEAEEEFEDEEGEEGEEVEEVFEEGSEEHEHDEL